MSDFLWVEKYRPKKIKECILSEDLKKTFTEFLKQGEIPNLLLSGTAGTGKTTVARALCEELGTDYIIINGSDEGRQIDTLRNKIKNFASTVSLSTESKHKVVILDEADYLNAQSTQPALRGFIEEFSKNCGFILTCNFRNRIIEPLHSRCSTIEFRIPADQKPNLAMDFMTRCETILDEQNIKYDKKVIRTLISKFFPDWRRVLNELQRYSASGEIDAGILVNLSEDSVKELMSFLKEKDFTKVRRWIVNNLDNDPSRIFRRLYDSLYNHLTPNSIPTTVVILADYSYKSAFVADQEINLLACMTEIMSQVKFK